SRRCAGARRSHRATRRGRPSVAAGCGRSRTWGKPPERRHAAPGAEAGRAAWPDQPFPWLSSSYLRRAPTTDPSRSERHRTSGEQEERGRAEERGVGTGAGQATAAAAATAAGATAPARRHVGEDSEADRLGVVAVGLQRERVGV